MNRNLLEKLARSLFPDQVEYDRFIAALVNGTSGEKAIVWVNERPAIAPFRLRARPAWLPNVFDWVESSEQPGASSWHSEGKIYCLDLSSAFAAACLTAIPSSARVRTVLDMCAAPGGKAICSWRMLQPQLMIANEVIGKRLPALISNFERCRVGPAIITRHDPGHFAKCCPGMVDLVIVDAPCSGQSLVARGEDSPGCFHPATINMNSNRQKRILANAASAVAPGGYLAYMTCTYSRQENEAVLEWLFKKFPEFKPTPVEALATHQSMLAGFPCYRLWPQKGEGSGAFTALLRRESQDPPRDFSDSDLSVVWSSYRGADRPKT